MFTVTRSALLAAVCATATLLPASLVHADTLSWGTSGYKYDSSQLTAPGTVGTSAGGNTVSIQYGFQNLPNGITSYFNNNYVTNNASTTQPSPAVGTYVANGTTIYTDGGTGGSKALQILANFDNAGNLVANAGIKVTVFFSQPVSDLMFSFWDVDNGTVQNNGPYNDYISGISGLTLATPGNPAAQTRPTSLSPGSANTSANGVDSGSFTASANNPQYGAAGNAGVSFLGKTITQFTFTYGDSLNAGQAHSNIQIIGLSDLTFTTVPEPSTWAMVGVAGIAGAWALRRRACRTA